MRSKTAISPTRLEDFNQWYQQVVSSADLAEHSPVRGCMVIKPWGYAIWERMQALLDKQFKLRNVSNIYCPVLIPVSFLEKEAEHVKGFASECAVVTHHRLEMNDEGKMLPAAPLAEPYVIRPTSEAIIGHMFSKWVQSYRDLPLLVNQWANVMRWEMRPRLFLRTSEFLWQEGHTAHAESGEAESMAWDMAHCYQTFMETVLAMPIIQGEKTAMERFPGALKTLTCEALMQDGKALQMGTSHFLGQYFSNAFDIQYLNAQGERKHAWTTSWGVSTRMIGGVIMSHSDDNGLLLPPALSPYQVVIVPVIHKETDRELVLDYVKMIQETMMRLYAWNESVRVHVDLRDMSSSEKKWSWVKRGVPVRLEIGARDLEQQQVVLFRRDNDEKVCMSMSQLEDSIVSILLDVQMNIWTRAKLRTENQIRRIDTAQEWERVYSAALDGAYLVPWCGSNDDEGKLAEHHWSIRCLLPSDHPWVQSAGDVRCIVSGAVTATWALIAKSY